ncbi:PREDICTED: tripartite motif-containing protein 7-like [Gekko japonicus]|uniref:RING-type E3 ubiquitin transferase n=1 Tax=Gekko japonicus TaxID=146911 RepID=A0ABM1KB09_GEKJA|nr:PREDICTED: tripartite motif-containing protein 7-like [Gekko japonicus]
MAAGGPAQELCEEASCSICLDYFRDPVSIAECGHSFCRACLTRSWGESWNDKPACPQCRRRTREGSLRPNWQLANLVEVAKKLSLQEGKEAGVEAGKGGVCQKHQEPLKLFCKDDEALICLVCDRSKEHRDHETLPLEEASQEYKDQFCSRREILKKERKRILAYKRVVEKESHELLQHELFLCCFSKSSLLLDQTSEAPCRDTLDSALHFQKANVTLDPDTAHPFLILSEDQKSVRRGEKAQALPNNPERFDQWGIVLGREGFTAGRHFWEVLVGSEEEWAVGVARKSVRRKGKITFSPEEGFWAVGKWDGGYCAAAEGDDPPLTLTRELKRIRVCLNYVGGRVAFFDADRAALLYEFSGASFPGETLLPFFWVRLEGHLQLC